MKITKQSEEVTYMQRTVTHTFTINDKTVRVYDYQKHDNVFDDLDYDQTIDENDLALLTEEEVEAMGENLGELLDLATGDEYDSEEGLVLLNTDGTVKK